MKKYNLLFMLCIFLFAFMGCSNQKPQVSIKNADDVAIYYGLSSYAMFGTDKDSLKTLKDIFNNLNFKRSQKEMDISTMLIISFSEKEKQIARICVDANGVFWPYENSECYEIESGTFNYTDVKAIYDKSKQSNK